MSGRNHHSVDMGLITETATTGWNGMRPNTKAAVAMTLKLDGYSTAQFGRCHEVPPGRGAGNGAVTSRNGPLMVGPVMIAGHGANRG
jgi:arylsulfatase A-like enzyme